MDELQKLRFDNNILKQKYELADAHRSRLWVDRDKLKEQLKFVSDRNNELVAQNERLKKDCKDLADIGSNDLKHKIALQTKLNEAYKKLSDLLNYNYVSHCRTDIEAILFLLNDTTDIDYSERMCPDAKEKGCPYEIPSRENCAHCQDLPVWYFDKETGKTVIVK